MHELSQEQQLAAEQITDCYQALAQQQSNVVWELLRHEDKQQEWDHYPRGDARDNQRRTQYFYHAHSSNDEDRMPEHGHFHLFFQQGVISSIFQPLVTSEKYQQSSGKEDNLCHVAAIAMNKQGMPTALFTVNHWVTMGAWYPADAIINELKQFEIAVGESGHPITDLWVSSMMVLFYDVIKELLYKRDEIILAEQKKHPEKDVFYNKELEITSVFNLERD